MKDGGPESRKVQGMERLERWKHQEHGKFGENGRRQKIREVGIQSVGVKYKGKRKSAKGFSLFSSRN